MKIAGKIAGAILGIVVLFLLYARLFGFDPVNAYPPRLGLWMTGELVKEPITDWSFAKDLPAADAAVETRQWFLPFLAHSVVTTRWHVKDRLYFGSGYPAGITLPNGRHWNANVLANPYVRIRLGKKLYDVKFTYVPDGPERDELLRHNGPMFFSPGFYLHPWRVDPRN